MERIRALWKQLLGWLNEDDDASADIKLTRRLLAAIAIAAILVVLVLWIISLLVPGTDLSGRTTALGALFSGLAFALLIITLIQQQHELGLQRRELHDTREELKRAAKAQEDQLSVQREDLSRQSREQFLSARLSACAATLQAQATAQGLGFLGDENEQGIQRNTALKAVQMSRLRIDLLALETRQGFAGGAWTPSIEKEAFRCYIVGSLRWCGTECDRFIGIDNQISITTYLASAANSLAILVDIVRANYPDIALVVEGIVGTLKGGAVDPGPVIAFCKTAENSFVKGQFPWI
jgi:hypothetical protein